jgi:hypothetical protein
MHSLIPFLIVALLLVAICVVPLKGWASGFLPQNRAPLTAYFANIAEGTHMGSLSKKADATNATRHLLTKFGSDADHYALCGASDIPLGPTPDEADAIDDLNEIRLLGIHKETLLMIASEAITAGEAVYTAAGGKVQDLPAGAGTYYKVGYALTAAAADGDKIEVQHCAPIATVVT